MTHQTIWFVQKHLNTKKIAKAAKDPKSKLWNHIIIPVRNSFIDQDVPDLKLQEHLDGLLSRFDEYCAANSSKLSELLQLSEIEAYKAIYGE